MKMQTWFGRLLAAGMAVVGVGLISAFTFPLMAETRNAKTVYGTDNRVEQYQVGDPGQLNVGQATVMLVDTSLMSRRGSNYVLDSATFNDYVINSYGKPLCSGVPFANQPAPGSCTGFLVAPDIVATAGHCVDTGCANTAFVFGFAVTNPDSISVSIPQSEVYFCKGLIGVQVDDSTGADWALVQLDRAVTGHTPLPVRSEGKVPDDAQLLMVGYPYGLPIKYVAGAKIINNNPPEYFEANLDALGGNSGSPVVNMQTGQVEGILVSGNDDFVEESTCVNETHLPDSGSPTTGAEQCSRTTIWAGMLNGGPLPPGAYSDPNAGAGGNTIGSGFCGPLGLPVMMTIALGMTLLRGRRWR